MEREETIRFYFSFRSPYSWLAAERIDAELGDLGVPIERLPVYPTPGVFPNDPAALPNKAAHLVQDVARLAREAGLTLRFPATDEVDWALPHAAFLAAEALGAGHAFMREAFRKRWSEGRDVGDEAVLAEAAEAAGLDAAAVLEAARSEALRSEAEAGFRRGIERDAIFGVPSFVYRGKLYWGQDRMRFVRSAVLRKRGGDA
jgi:2-hydroxychromene-2-carboxylate isomerase